MQKDRQCKAGNNILIIIVIIMCIIFIAEVSSLAVLNLFFRLVNNLSLCTPRVPYLDILLVNLANASSLWPNS